MATHYHQVLSGWMQLEVLDWALSPITLPNSLFYLLRPNLDLYFIYLVFRNHHKKLIFFPHQAILHL
jgi:hypothetical protein